MLCGTLGVPPDTCLCQYHFFAKPAGISQSMHRGDPDRVLIDTRMKNACIYFRMPDDYMIPFIDEMYPTSFYFQNGNAAPHCAYASYGYFMEQGLMATYYQSKSKHKTQ